MVKDYDETVHSNRRSNRINIKRLKRFALEKLPRDSALRDILLFEEDELDLVTFIERIPIWLRLGRSNVKRRQL